MSEHETMTKQPEGDQEMNAPIKNPMMELRSQMQRMDAQWTAALPKHIRVDHFMRVVQTAIQNNPQLIAVDRRSLWNACTQAAQDGLLPDTREGVIVPFKGKAKWMPMYQGLIKKARNSGEIATIVARVVYKGDHYRYWIDEEGEHLNYEPTDNPDLATVVRVFAMAKTRDGELLVEPMSRAEIERVRSSSQTGREKGSPWDVWWDEMAKKTAIRRLSKRLPTSPELEQAIRRDDELYDSASRQAKPMVEIPNDDTPAPRPIRSLEDFGNGHGKKGDPAKRSRGRPKKPDPTPEPEPEMEPEWLANYREDLAQCETADEVQDSWDAINDDFAVASDELKAVASELYNANMERVNPEPDSYA
jgi:phage RecT family recombinase